MNTNRNFLMCQQEQTMFNDVDVGDAKPTEQHPYRSNSLKQHIHKEEFQYLLENSFIDRGSSGFFRGSVLGQDTSEPSLVLVKPRKDMNNVSCHRDMTEVLFKAA